MQVPPATVPSARQGLNVVAPTDPEIPTVAPNRSPMIHTVLPSVDRLTPMTWR
jgi:hypothetical protein